MKKWIETLESLIPFLEAYPIWVKLIISAWVLLTAVAVIGLIFFRITEATPSKGPDNASSGSASRRVEFDTAFQTAGSLEELRKKNGVRELRPLENDLNLSRLPNGIYGFTVPWIINTDSTGVVGGTGLSRISLHRTGGGTAVMEMHKSEQGQVYIIGFVTQDQLIRMQDPSRRASLGITLFFHPYQNFDELVAVPYERIISSDNRSVEGYYVNDIDVH